MTRAPGLISRLDQTGIPLLVTRVVLGSLFVWMGIVKILNPVDFVKLMQQYALLPLLPHYVLNIVAVVLPWIETLCGVALLLGIGIRGAGLVSAVMLVMFTPLILIRGLEIYYQGGVSFCQVSFDCGCGAGIIMLCSKLAENFSLFLLALAATLSRSRRFCLGARRLPSAPSMAVAR
ncbi:MAG: DoxX family membrane protein [Phycisphaerae bacterium]|nr:DoxX family membrane protein [Phycisphaerae bacterium]